MTLAFRYRVSIVLIMFVFGSGVSGARAAEPGESVEPVVREVRALLDEYQFQAALDVLTRAIGHTPAAAPLHKLSGDVLMILRRHEEALSAYRQAVKLAPEWVDAQWALWALLTRVSADPEEVLSTLQAITRVEAENPLVHLRLGRTLHELKRYEDAAAHFRRAVQLAPEHPAFRLYLARALFDILDMSGAQAQVQWVLDHAPHGSPAWVAAQNLAHVVRGETTDQGARSDFFATTKKPYGETGKDYKTWALTRERAWREMKTGDYVTAEALWRETLVLDPQDDLARYYLGLTLMKLSRYDEAIEMLQASLAESREPPYFADALFQIGQSYVRLEQWHKAIPYFRTLLALKDRAKEDYYAMNFPDLSAIQAALEDARRHVKPGMAEATLPWPIAPEPDRTTNDEPAIPRENVGLPHTSSSLAMQDREAGSTQVLPISVDTVRGWFRELMTARSVVRDDLQTGSHEFYPLDPSDSFRPDQPEIYVVFALTTPPSVATTVTSRWVAEQVEGLAPETVIGIDAVAVGLNDTTGYFVLDRPEGGWPAGLYRIDLFTGDTPSSSTNIANVRFRVVAPVQ
ncbi:MAG: tetratricopeptide repeat protein [Nitrospirae bacterium]|nr:MAG: tetratricopeptide repeat protein [Nitrospirota bacterium]